MKKTAATFLFILLMMLTPGQSFAGVFVSVRVAPPPLVVYEQPLVPGPGYLWMPGYWAYDDEGWYWVPGAWVLPPERDLLWTPGYWDYDDYGDIYIWHAGYWGPHVGFYGGVAYGYGYTGYGYYGGYWNHGVFWYNSSCSHVDRTFIHTSYSKTVIINTNVNHYSYNGGPGHEKFRPTQAELQYGRDHHFAATPDQLKHQQLAMSSKETHFSYNHGRPAVAATFKAGDFSARASSGKPGPGTPHGFSANNGQHGLQPSGPTTAHVAGHGEGPGNPPGFRPGDPHKVGGDKFAHRSDPRLNGPYGRPGKPGHGAGHGYPGQHVAGNAARRPQRPPNNQQQLRY
jgi:WXXGXW repeat (2 copies)